jgi:hypothetical protein
VIFTASGKMFHADRMMLPHRRQDVSCRSNDVAARRQDVSFRSKDVAARRHDVSCRKEDVAVEIDDFSDGFNEVL